MLQHKTQDALTLMIIFFTLSSTCHFFSTLVVPRILIRLISDTSFFYDFFVILVTSSFSKAKVPY